MRTLLLLIFCTLFSYSTHAQRIKAGEMSFLLNGEKISLNLSAAELNKTNLVQVKMRGEKNGDTLIIVNFGFILKKLAISPDMIAEPSFEFTLMKDIRKAGRATQLNANRDGKTLTWVEKKGDKSENYTLNTVKQNVLIKKIELKEGNLYLNGEFSAEYESPASAPMIQKISITAGKFAIQM